MTTRKDVSVIENKFIDAQRVDKLDMEVEQNRNNEIDAAIVNNHFGSGVLISAPEQTILFDSDDLDSTSAALLSAGNFDGTGLSPTAQPSDINLGNQLEVELTDSAAFGRLSVKVAIIGLSFDGTLQMDRFYFYRNGKQVTSKHYKKILTIFTNDFKGNNNCSRELGGRLVIRETSSFQLSSDPVMVAQDLEPDVFWRDFKKANPLVTLYNTIQTGIGSEYSLDALDINVTGKPSRELIENDVTSQIGQKFKATTNNIQKVTLLLGVARDTTVSVANEFDWAGDLVVSIYPLQTTVSSPTDIVPSLAIDFDPASVPLAQISYSQATLKDYGYVLTDVAQPVDFVFSSTAIGSTANGGVIQKDKFYAVTIRRSGAATTGKIQASVGANRLEDSRLTLFSSVWVDVEEQDLWFQIWTDAAKIADGQAYDNGNGILYPKTDVDATTGATIDYQAKAFPLSNTGESVLNTGVIQAVLGESVQIQDERTGNPVFSRKKYVPSFSFVSEAGLEELKATSEPLIIGAMEDTNPKINPTLTKTQNLPGLAKNDTFCIVNPDSDLISLNLLGSKLIPNTNNSAVAYKIFKVTSCVDGYGDVNGDGYIDSTDVTLATTLVGEGLALATTQQKIKDGEFTTLDVLRADVDGDGYVTTNDVNLITSFVNRATTGFPAGTSFNHICLEVQQLVGRYDGYFDCDGYVRLDGYLGTNVVLPSSLSSSDLVYDGYVVTTSMEVDSLFTAVPFAGTTYQIVPQPFWQPYLLNVSSDCRKVPASFTFPEKITKVNPSASPFKCSDKNEVDPAFDPGRNDFYVPDNMIIGKGELLRPDGSFYPVDVEIGTIVLQLPQTPLTESSINIFDKFVSDRGDGFTRAGYPAMRYADYSTVQSTDLTLGKVRFGVSIQSFYPNLDGYSVVDGYGVICDDIIGAYIDYTTGILRLTIKDLAVDSVYQTLVTKIQIQVFLKKAGWNNKPLFVGVNEIAGLISS